MFNRREFLASAGAASALIAGSTPASAERMLHAFIPT
jgi:hypothetical protein